MLFSHKCLMLKRHLKISQNETWNEKCVTNKSTAEKVKLKPWRVEYSHHVPPIWLATLSRLQHIKLFFV